MRRLLPVVCLAVCLASCGQGGGEGPGDGPERFAASLEESLNRADGEAYVDAVCASRRPADRQAAAGEVRSDAESIGAEVAVEREMPGGRYAGTVTRTADGGPSGPPLAVVFSREDGGWCFTVNGSARSDRVDADLRSDLVEMAIRQEEFMTDNPAANGFPVAVAPGETVTIGGRTYSASEGTSVEVAVDDDARSYCVRATNTASSYPDGTRYYSSNEGSIEDNLLDPPQAC